MSSISSFYNQNNNSYCLSVTTTSHAAVQITGNLASNIQVRVRVVTNDVFLVFSQNGTAAVIPTDGTPANGMCVPPGVETFTIPQNSMVTAICAAGNTATVYLTPGEGM